MTEQQRLVFDFIRTRLEQTGVAPNYTEIGEVMGTKSRGAAHDMVSRLVRDGLLEKTEAGSRNLKLPGVNLLAVPTSTLVAELERRRALPVMESAEDHVAVCGACDRRASDPAVRGCTAPNCPLRVKEAA